MAIDLDVLMSGMVVTDRLPGRNFFFTHDPTFFGGKVDTFCYNVENVHFRVDTKLTQVDTS